MVFFVVVKPKTKEVGRNYCRNRDDLFDLVKNVNEFVMNNDPYKKEYLEYSAERYEKIRTGRDRWGDPFQKRFIESHRPPYTMNNATKKYEVTEREAEFIKEDIDDTCETDFTRSFRRSFAIPTICAFNKDKSVLSSDGMDRCANNWKNKIDEQIPEFRQFGVEIQYEY